MLSDSEYHLNVAKHVQIFQAFLKKYVPTDLLDVDRCLDFSGQVQ